MKWVLFVSENEDSTNLLEILNREPADRLQKTLKQVKILTFGSGPYIEAKNKKVKKMQKILSTLILSSQPVQTRKPQQQQQDIYDYDSSMHDIMFDNTQDDPDEMENSVIKEKERVSKRAAEIQATRDSSRPPSKIPKDPPIQSENYDTMEAEEGMDKYFEDLMKKS